MRACVLQTSMAFWSIDSKSPESLIDRRNDMSRELTDAVSCRRSINSSTPETTHDVGSGQEPSRTKNDDSVPSPDTPLRERRLPASFWQEPNVPRRSVRTSSWRAMRRADAAGRMSSGTGIRHHQPPPGFCQSQPATLFHRRQFQYPSAADLAFSTGTATDSHAFLRNWKDAPAFNFDVPTKPQPASSAVDFVRHIAHLSPWSVASAGLPNGYPLLAPDYASHGGSLAANNPSEELAASAAVVAAYLRWRAVEEDCKPVVESVSTRPFVADWPSMMCQPCSTAATASVAIQRFHRYHPY